MAQPAGRQATAAGWTSQAQSPPHTGVVAPCTGLDRTRSVRSTPRMRILPILMLALVYGPSAPRLVQSATADELATLAGSPAIVEIPTVEDLGVPLSVPRGWGYRQASAEDVDALRVRFGVAEGTACVLYLDEHGNALVRDVGPQRRRRVAEGVSEFRREQHALRAALEAADRARAAARARGREREELAEVRGLLARGLRGYREIEEARQRWRELDTERWRRALRVLAKEGVAPRTRLVTELKQLEQISEGLPSTVRIERARRKLEAGFTVQKPAPR